MLRAPFCTKASGEQSLPTETLASKECLRHRWLHCCVGETFERFFLRLEPLNFGSGYWRLSMGPQTLFN